MWTKSINGVIYMKYKKTLIIIFSMVIVFFSTYMATRFYYEKNTVNVVRESGAFANIPVKDKTEIILKSKNQGSNEYSIDQRLTIEELRDYLGKNGMLTREEVESYYNKLNYSLESVSDNQIVLSREYIKKLSPNKFYIGEKDDCLTIYTTDKDGIPFIKNADRDILRDKRRVSTFDDNTRNFILNFKKEFDSREDAYEFLTGLL